MTLGDAIIVILILIGLFVSIWFIMGDWSEDK